MDNLIPSFVNDWINLAQPRLGAEVIYSTDDFFAEANRMLKPEEPVFIEGKFDGNGKWMDGWETRRRRNGGYDHAIVKLGLPGIIKGIDIDTRHFTGNFAPATSLEACNTNTAPDQNTQWVMIIPSVSLQGDSHHYFEIDEDLTFSHLRLNLYPDGGVARLRVYGQVQCDWENKDKS
jgi:allantoicase